MVPEIAPLWQVGRALTRVAGLLAAMVVAGGCLAPAADLSPLRGDEPAVTVWVLDHGWHTAIVVCRADLERAPWPELEDFPAATFIEVAWGRPCLLHEPV